MCYALWMLILISGLLACESGRPPDGRAPVQLAVAAKPSASRKSCGGAGEDGSGCVYGIFVGMSEDGRDPALPYADADARNLAEAFQYRGLMRSSDGIVLTNRDATRDAINQAFQALITRMTSRDVFVFFFDGHGRDRALGIWNNDLSYVYLDRLLRRVPAQQSVVILDTCSAGSFASVGRTRNRGSVAGFFSSRREEVSVTAVELLSGGYLAAFFIHSLYQLDGDGTVSIHDLRVYLGRRYQEGLGPKRRQHLIASDGSAILWRITPTATTHMPVLLSPSQGE